MPLSFPSCFRYFDDARNCITAPACDTASGRRVPVRIPVELLITQCGAIDESLGSLFAAYDRHRTQLQGQASRRFDSGRIERDGSVRLITASAVTGDATEPPKTPAPVNTKPRHGGNGGSKRGFGRLLSSLRH